MKRLVWIMIFLFVLTGAASSVMAGELEDKLLLAADLGTVDAVRTLLVQGADINAKDSYGDTTLIKVVRYGKADMARFLLDKGADPNEKNKYGETALHLAASYGETDVVRALLDKSADVEAKDQFGETALYRAVWWDKTDVVRVLLAKGADPSAKKDNGETALSLAAGKGKADIVRLLKNPGDAGQSAETARVEGFLGVLWGADRQQVEAAMADKGYLKLYRPQYCAGNQNNELCAPNLLRYDGVYAGERAEIRYWFDGKALVRGTVYIGFNFCSDVQTNVYNKLVAALQDKYGPSSMTNSYGHPLWLLTAGDPAGDQVEISVCMEKVILGGYMANGKPWGQPGWIEISYTNKSLQQKQKNDSI